MPEPSDFRDRADSCLRAFDDRISIALMQAMGELRNWIYVVIPRNGGFWSGRGDICGLSSGTLRKHLLSDPS